MDKEEKEFSINGMSERQIVAQVQNEYKICYEFMKPKINEWLVRLRLYNNQKRDKKKVGDSLLFTVFQTLFASLYNDRLMIKFHPNEEGDIEVANNLNDLAKYDNNVMRKDILDFEWDWDALFFGRGLMLEREFDRKLMAPVPEVIDPVTFLRDPEAQSVNGNLKGYNALRFFGREISLSKYDLEKNKTYFNIDLLKKGEELKSLLNEARKSRNDAQGLSSYSNNREDSLKENSEYNLLEWFTHIKGERYLLTLGNQKTLLIRAIKMTDQDRWPLIDRPLFPMAHSWDGVSIPDLVEDKQRARAILMNLGLKSAKASAEPMYLFDENRVKNRSDLNFGFNKFVRIDGPVDGAVAPMMKSRISEDVKWIIDILDQSTQRSLATPELQQGVPSGQQRTLGELELVSSKVDTRYSLATKIFGWSEKEFWRQWYHLYKKHFRKGIDKKIIRIEGVWGSKFRPLLRDNIVATRIDPDVEVESAILAEAKRIKEREEFGSYIGVAFQDPNINRNFALKKLATLNGLSDQEVKILFPPTIDEIEAEKENEMIEKKQLPAVNILQDHQQHIMIHSKLNPSKTRDAHIKAHQYAMFLKRKYQEIFQQREQMQKPPVEQQGQTATQKPQQATGGLQPKRTIPIPQSYQQKPTTTVNK